MGNGKEACVLKLCLIFEIPVLISGKLIYVIYGVIGLNFLSRYIVCFDVECCA